LKEKIKIEKNKLKIKTVEKKNFGFVSPLLIVVNYKDHSRISLKSSH